MRQAPRLSLIIPTRGDDAQLMRLAAAIERQTLAPERFQRIVVLDGVAPSPMVLARLGAVDAAVVKLPERSGPGAARNAGARQARGEFLAFSEDDVTPAGDWLERALARLDADPGIDVLEGVTVKPGGRPVRTLAAEGASWIPTNLFVRRSLFERVGGYHEGYFDGARGIYFREDSDLGFMLEEAGARVARAPDVVVTHPDEHTGYLDPLRWARRYEMDALLAARHPARFRERIEVHRLGPFTVRRPIVRAAVMCVLAFAAAMIAWLLRERALVPPLLLLAAVAFVPIWAKWRFSPLRLPVVLLVPFALVAALVRGRARVPLSTRSRPGTRART
ncbi:MAG: glycosyltransferase family 2 protein [Candidatus Eiseniibacteriota bacterium]